MASTTFTYTAPQGARIATAYGNKAGIRLSPEDVAELVERDRKIRMKRAEAMFSHEVDPKTGKKGRRLKPAESHAKWASTVGKRVLAKSE